MVTQVADLDALGLGDRPEGLAVAPNTFGALAGQAIIAIEGSNPEDPESGKIYAVPGSGASATLLTQIPGTAEGVVFVPPLGGTRYICQLEFEGIHYNRILAATASQFLARRGRFIAHSEMMNEFYEIASVGGSDYTHSYVGRVPGTWTSEGLDSQSTELEAVAFAVQPPTHPTWGPWSSVPILPAAGVGFGTDLPPAAAANWPGQIERGYVVAVSNGQPAVFLPNGIYSLRLLEQLGVLVWDTLGWQPVGGGVPIQTTKPIAAAVFDNRLNVIYMDGSEMKLFEDAMGGITTTIATQFDRPAAVAANGKLVIAAADWTNSAIHIREVPTERAMPPHRDLPFCWTTVPGVYTLDPGTGPALAFFQGELYVFRTTEQRMFVIARDGDGVWTDWAEIPGTGRTPATIAAAGAAPGEMAGLVYTPYGASGPFHDDPTIGKPVSRGIPGGSNPPPPFTLPLAGQLHVLVSGTDTGIYQQLASETGTWDPDWSGTGGNTALGLAMFSVLRTDPHRTPTLYAFARAFLPTPHLTYRVGS